MARHNEYGKWGEEQAAAFLQQKGYQLLDQNYRFEKGEIDLIFLLENTVVFVEVKTRKHHGLFTIENAINEAKQQLLIDTAEAYLEEKNLNLNARFDVVLVIGTKPEFQHLEDALSG